MNFSNWTRTGVRKSKGTADPYLRIKIDIDKNTILDLRE
jgi:hypothetical protein